ncbi:MAG: alpha/beta hydrolase, partial [Deltaproteobacteria bacterium]|nr:alpha/beta hydrolase [Deltaproteobacteria bacterium]
LDAFKRYGLSMFRAMLRNLLKKDPGPGLERYDRDLDRADPAALHQCARSLVQESRDGNLRKRFLDLSVPKAYFGGEKSMNPRHRAFLTAHGIPCHVVPGTGHFMMDDRPDLFWPLLEEAFGNAATQQCPKFVYMGTSLVPDRKPRGRRITLQPPSTARRHAGGLKQDPAGGSIAGSADKRGT